MEAQSKNYFLDMATNSAYSCMHKSRRAGGEVVVSPPNQAVQPRDLHAPEMQVVLYPTEKWQSGIIKIQAMSHLLRTNGMHQMVNLVNGVISPNMR